MIKNRYVIGDVHGCYYTLLALLKQLPKDANIIFIGDLIDRGNFSREVVNLVIEKGYTAIMGNHENHFIKCSQDDEYSGRGQALKSYKNYTEYLEKYIEWFKTLPKYIEIDNLFITHAFAFPYYKRKDDDKYLDVFLHNRRVYEKKYGDDWEDWRSYDVINIYGHEVQDEVIFSKNYIKIDTGAAYGGKLSALNLETMEVVSQKTDLRDIEKRV